MDYADIVKPTTFADADYFYRLTAHMRTHDPVPYIESETHKSFWIATKHADIVEIEKQNDKFLNTNLSVLQSDVVEQASREAGILLRTLINMDGSEHLKFRDLTKDWFMPTNLKTVEARVRELAKQAVDRMLDQSGELDFVSDVAVWYPLHVIMMILGVPESDEARMLKLTQELFGADDPDMRRQVPTAEERIETITDFFQYFTAMTEDRRQNPGTDVATVIANAQIDGEPIGYIEAISYYVIIATAGHDTTSSSIAGGLLALLQNPGEFAKVRDNPHLLPLAIDEIIRWVTPVKHFLRFATEDYVLRGRSIKEGQPVMMLYPSGNRDEEVFDDPEQFKVDRRPNRHLAFGYGVHHCLGNILARMEIRYFYEELFRRVKSIELAGEPRLVQSIFVSGLKTLPVRVKAK